MIQFKQLPHRLPCCFYFREFFISEQSQSKSGGNPASKETGRKYDCSKHLILRFVSSKKFSFIPTSARNLPPYQDRPQQFPISRYVIRESNAPISAVQSIPSHACSAYHHDKRKVFRLPSQCRSFLFDDPVFYANVTDLALCQSGSQNRPFVVQRFSVTINRSDNSDFFIPLDASVTP